MYLFKAPIVVFAFLLLLTIPESSFAQQCSAQAGKIYGCRSGIACNQKNKRTGADLWVCQDVGAAAAPAEDTSSSAAATSSSSGSTRSSSKKTTKKDTAKLDCGAGFTPDSAGTGCISLEKACENDPQCSKSPSAASEEQSLPLASPSGVVGEGISSARSSVLDGIAKQGECPSGYLEVKSNNQSDYVEAAGDMQAGSYPPYAVRFCRKAGMTQEQANAYKNNGSGQTCKAENGQEFQENGVRKCRYIDPGESGEAQVAMVCFIENGQLTDCKAEDSAKVADGGSCEQRFNEARNVCFAQADKASTDCDQENQGIQDAMNATKAVGAGSAASMQLACSKLGEISKIANASLTGWQTFCAFSQSGCETAFSDAKVMYNDPNCIPAANKKSYSNDMTTIQQNVNVCLGYKKRISEAAQHATAALVQMQAAKKCETDTNALTTASLDECKKNPNNPLCTDAQKCSNAEFAASNKVCSCITNPSSKECIAATGGAGSRGVAGGATIPGVGGGKGTDAGTAQIGGAGSSGPDPFATSLQNGAVKNEQNLGGAKGNAGLGGNGGGAGGAGGGGGLGSNAASAGGGAPEDKNKINSGFYGGGAAGGGYFGKGGGVSGGYRPNAGGVNYNKLGAGGAQFDPRRYIAGLNGKTGEYINGPNMDIFRIVKNRIESKKPTMLDPDYKK